MRFLIIVILTVFVQGCSVYGKLSTCDGFAEGGSACTPLSANLEYSKQRERGIEAKTSEPTVEAQPKNRETKRTARNSRQRERVPSTRTVISSDINSTLPDQQVKNDEFARLALVRKLGMSESDPILKPAKVVRATIYPYSDGGKFYQLRHIWIKTHEEEWIVGNSMVVNRDGTVMMGSNAAIKPPVTNTIIPAPKPAPTLEPTPTPRQIENVEELESGDIVTINCFYLNIRNVPMGRIVGVVESGAKLRIEGKKHENWYLVTVLSKAPKRHYTGWVDSTYLTGTIE